jgi:hypothetical protein
MALRFIICLILVCLPVGAGDGWALSTPDNATRRVIVTLSDGSQEIEKWVLPVAHDASQVKDYVQTKWITLPTRRPKDFPSKIFTDTWLGSIDADEAWVRVEWWPHEQRDGMERLVNNYVATTYKATQTLKLGKGLQIAVVYEDAVKQSPKPTPTAP